MNSILGRFSPALRIGILFGVIGLALTVVGIARGNVPLQPASIAMALLIGGGVWFLVSWAVATAATDVESDLAHSEQEQEG
jgi:putative Mn2+ efflux pump MntP